MCPVMHCFQQRTQTFSASMHNEPDLSRLLPLYLYIYRADLTIQIPLGWAQFLCTGCLLCCKQAAALHNPDRLRTPST